MNTKKAFTYDLFIASRNLPADLAWAQWLSGALRKYRVSAELQKKGIAGRVGEIFTDKKELAISPNVNDDTLAALESSAALLVICTRATAESLWIQTLINRFRETGRGDRIFALLAEGEPAESFPRALCEITITETAPTGETRSLVKEIEPLAADVRPRSDLSGSELKKMALLRILAGILGCSFDDLRQREKLRRRRKILFRVGALGALLLLIASGLLAWYLYNMPEREWYANYVYRFGIPMGIGKMEKSAAAQRQSSFCFETKNGRFLRMQQRNGSGYPQEDAEGICTWEAEYLRSGTNILFNGINCFNKNGTLVMYRWYSPDRSIIELRGLKGSAYVKRSLSLAVDAWDRKDAEKKSMIFRLVTAMDARGYITNELYYRDAYGTPAADADGNYGRSIIVNEEGHILRYHYIGMDGKPKITKDGISGEVYSYGRYGDQIESWYIDDSGRLVMPKETQFAGWQVYRDFFGNPTNAAYYTHKKEKALSQNVHSWWAEYDKRGNEVARVFFGTDNRSVLVKNGYAVWRRKYDKRGNAIESAHFGTDGKLVLIKNGYAVLRMKYDERGNTVENAYFGTDGKPVLDRNGNAISRGKYDERGKIVESAYFGTDGKLVLVKNGYAVLRMKYDARGNEIESAFFDTDGKPVLHRDGYAIIRNKYDERGNEVERAFLGTDGKPVLCRDGYAVWRDKYDARGNAVETAYFGTDDKPVVHRDGNAIMRNKYDERGNEVETAYFGTDGKPVKCRDGYAIWRRKYDERGNTVESAYFGTDSKPVLHRDGLAKWCSKYDEWGNNVERAFFGTDGKPIVVEDISRWVAKYDEKGNEVERAYFDPAGKLVLHKDHYAIVRITYDDYDRKTMFKYYNEMGNLTLKAMGFAIEQKKFDINGNLTNTSWHGTDGNLIIRGDGYAMISSSFNERNLEILRMYYNEKQQPCAPGIDDTSGHEMHFDARGNMTNKKYLGIDSRPALNKSKYCEERIKYNERNQVVEAAFFGTNKEPVLTDLRYHIIRRKYDTYGNEIELAVYDTNNELTEFKVSGLNIARIESEFDVFGYVKSRLFFRKGGQVIKIDGIEKNVKRNDVFGNTIETGFFTLNGDVMTNSAGYAGYVSYYNSMGTETNRIYFDRNHKPVTSWDDSIPILEIGEIFEGFGKDHGVLVGDILLEWGVWKYFDKAVPPEETINLWTPIVERTRAQARQVCFWREGKIFRLLLPPNIGLKARVWDRRFAKSIFLQVKKDYESDLKINKFKFY